MSNVNLSLSNTDLLSSAFCAGYVYYQTKDTKKSLKDGGEQLASILVGRNLSSMITYPLPVVANVQPSDVYLGVTRTGLALAQKESQKASLIKGVRGILSHLGARYANQQYQLKYPSTASVSP